MTFTSTYNHLNVPDQWNDYFSKYPNGYTILEAVINWAGQVNDMTDTLNSTTDYVNNFMTTFDTDLSQTTKDTLTQWQTDGTLDTIISQALKTDLGDITTLKTVDKTSAVNAINENNDRISEILKDVRDYNIKGDGTDETASFLTALNDAINNHYTLYIPKEVTISINSVTITGSKFGIHCEGTIKRLDNITDITSLLTLLNCSDVKIPLINFDGNGLNNGCIENTAYTSYQEQRHNLVINACTNIDIGTINNKNTSGDGVYITGGSKNITIYKVMASADKFIGRNIVSIISGADIFIDYIYGDNFGHYDMPGGLDLEPNANTDRITNVNIGKLYINSGGTFPLALQATNGATVQDITVDSATIQYSSPVSSSTEFSGCIISATRVNINILIVINKTSNNLTFLTIDNTGGVTPIFVHIKDGYGENCYRGISLGYTGSVEDIYVKAKLKNLSLDGVNPFNGKNIELHVDIDGIGTGRSMLSKSQGANSGIVDTLKLSGKIPYDSKGALALSLGDVPANIVNWLLEDLDFTGWGNDQRIKGQGGQGDIKKINCKNLTSLASQPNFESWKIGDIIYNTNPIETGSTGSMYIIDKWVAIGNGSGPSIWRQSRVLTGN